MQTKWVRQVLEKRISLQKLPKPRLYESHIVIHDQRCHWGSLVNIRLLPFSTSDNIRFVRDNFIQAKCFHYRYLTNSRQGPRLSGYMSPQLLDRGGHTIFCPPNN